MLRLPLPFAAILAVALFTLGILLDHRSAMAAQATPTATAAGAVSKIVIADDAFKPVSLSVTVGTQVTWTNQDDDPHTITSTQPLFDSNGLALGDSFSYVFRKPGTYTYYCKVHPFMKGTIIVKGNAS